MIINVLSWVKSKIVVILASVLGTLVLILSFLVIFLKIQNDNLKADLNILDIQIKAEKEACEESILRQNFETEFENKNDILKDDLEIYLKSVEDHIKKLKENIEKDHNERDNNMLDND